MIGWLKRRRRRRITAEPFPDAWGRILHRNMALWHPMDGESREKLSKLIQVFIAERTWEFCGGLNESDEIKVTVAGHACLLLLGIEHDYFRNVSSIIMYPSAYMDPSEQEEDDDGFVLSDPDVRLGEAHFYGPVVLAWDSIKRAGIHPERGHNVVYHEFAHKLDMLDGDVNGTPALSSRKQYARWHQVMRREYERLCDASEQGRATLLDQYGCLDPGEFFAVAVECFFDRPVALEAKHPALYQVLQAYFNQDPSRWFATD